jgi:hypothetical protein
MGFSPFAGVELVVCRSLRISSLGHYAGHLLVRCLGVTAVPVLVRGEARRVAVRRPIPVDDICSLPRIEVYVLLSVCDYLCVVLHSSRCVCSSVVHHFFFVA